MTELQWQLSTAPAAMLRHLGKRASARKLQLLGVAACRSLRSHFDGESVMTRLLDIVERHAEGETTQEEWQWGIRMAQGLAVPDLGDVMAAGGVGSAEHPFRMALFSLVSTPVAVGVERTLDWLAAGASRVAGPGKARDAEQLARRTQAYLVREIFGNPFIERTVVPAWMSTGGSAIFAGQLVKVSETAKALADGVEADQAYERLPILADAMEEAGCTDPEFLAHLREPGHHVRGCWALDLVLGKS